jgi:hypothetical protein
MFPYLHSLLLWLNSVCQSLFPCHSREGGNDMENQENLIKITIQTKNRFWWFENNVVYLQAK